VFHRVNHAGEASVGDHLDVDEVRSPICTTLIVDGGVESDGIASEELI
jgi:hypothetical protein